MPIKKESGILLMRTAEDSQYEPLGAAIEEPCLLNSDIPKEIEWSFSGELSMSVEMTKRLSTSEIFMLFGFHPSNNWRKLHGFPVMRRRYLKRYGTSRISRTE